MVFENEVLLKEIIIIIIIYDSKCFGSPVTLAGLKSHHHHIPKYLKFSKPQLSHL